jgi:outer membrane lipoprotein SlyB
MRAQEYAMGLMDVFSQVLSAGQASDQHFDQVSQAVPTDVVAAGLAHAFRSDQTPDIGAMVGQLFGNSNGSQQAGMLNQIIAALGPAVAAGLAGGKLGDLLNGASAISPAQASQLSPQQVSDIVQEAHDAHPGIADELAGFYAQHSTLIKTLGGAALAIAMAKMKDRLEQR